MEWKYIFTQLFTGLLLTGLLSSCSPKIKSVTFSNKPSLNAFASVLVLEEAELEQLKKESNIEEIAKIRISEQAMTVNCSYEAVINLAKSEARKMGGNLLKITEHRKPNFLNSCHRIQCQVYHADDISRFEKDFVWLKGRKLEWRDFKGDPGEMLNFSAATSSNIEVTSFGNPLTGNVKWMVLAKFYCNTSWVREGLQDNYILNHEQKHFDIAEIFARKIRKELKESEVSRKNVRQEGWKIYERLHRSFVRYQDLYDIDTDHGVNTIEQAKWDKQIEQELHELKKYSLED